MIGKRANKDPGGAIDSFLGPQVQINGDLVFSGGLRLHGKVFGNVFADGKSTLVLSEGAEVHGEINVPHLLSNGHIFGNVHAAERIELHPSAKIRGNVHYKALVIAAGAMILGKLQHSVNGTVTKRPRPVAVGADPS